MTIAEAVVELLQRGLRARRLNRRQKSPMSQRRRGADPVQSLRRLSRQAPTGGPGAGPAPPEDAAKDPRALVGFATSDDAAVYRLTRTPGGGGDGGLLPAGGGRPVRLRADRRGERALRRLGDGRAAALRAQPGGLPHPGAAAGDAGPQILAGGQSKADEAGIPILGGHSVRRPRAQVRHGGHRAWCTRSDPHQRRRPSRATCSSSPSRIGSGIATTAIKRGIATQELEASVVELMSRLNRAAGEVFASGKFPVHALTDVTGFGLLGHLAGDGAAERRLRARLFARARADHRRRARARGAGRGARRDEGQPRALRHARALPATGCRDPIRRVLADAQTNGGLLAAVPRAALREGRAGARPGGDRGRCRWRTVAVVAGASTSSEAPLAPLGAMTSLGHWHLTLLGKDAVHEATHYWTHRGTRPGGRRHRASRRHEVHHRQQEHDAEERSEAPPPRQRRRRRPTSRDTGGSGFELRRSTTEKKTAPKADDKTDCRGHPGRSRQVARSSRLEFPAGADVLRPGFFVRRAVAAARLLPRRG